MLTQLTVSNELLLTQVLFELFFLVKIFIVFFQECISFQLVEFLKN